MEAVNTLSTFTRKVRLHYGLGEFFILQIFTFLNLFYCAYLYIFKLLFLKFIDGGGVIIYSTLNIEWVCAMKLEKFKEKNSKKKFIIGFTMCCIFLLVGVFF